MDRFLYLTFDGLSRGAVYAAFALALVLIWRAARIVNFAQGAMAVATAYAGYSVADATGSYWLGSPSRSSVAWCSGRVVERVVMRFVDHSSPLNGVVVALGLVLIIQGVLGMIYGNEFQPARRRSAGTRSRSAGSRCCRATTCSCSPRWARWSCCSRFSSPVRRPACACAPRRSRPTSPGCSACRSAAC
jgi:branched-subunit amino acid ABC-type transport system permease component